MDRFFVSYSRSNGKEIRSSSESFEGLADAIVYFNKMCINDDLGFSIVLADIKANTILKHYVHNRYPRRDVFVRAPDQIDENASPDGRSDQYDNIDPGEFG